MDFTRPDIANPDRGYCAVEGCNCLQRNRGKGYGWGLLCDKHHRANRFTRMKERREKQIALEIAHIARKKAKEAYKNRPERICSKCGATKIRAEFPRYKGNVCKDCRRRYDKGRKPIIYNPALGRKHTLRQYGVDESWYNTKFAEQKGLCAICGKHQANFKKRLSIDHCHTTGKLRGLLCTRCNLLIGGLENTPYILESLLSYLKKHGQKLMVLQRKKAL